MALTRRLVKGSALTSAEHDANIDHFEQNPDGILIPKAADRGIRIDPAAPDWGWRDLKGDVDFEEGAPTAASLIAYQGNIKQRQFAVGDECQIVFHFDHDYVEGSEVYLHVHWSHNNASVTSGSVVWQAEMMYAKGHDQSFFSTPLVLNITQTASTTRYQHMVAEDVMSAPLGAGGLIPTEDLEADGMMICRLKLLSCDINGGVLPFFHQCDIHHQSTGVGTKNRAPAFHV